MAPILCFTDIHWGKKNDSQEHNAHCTDFMSWMLGVADDVGARTIVFMGDWHDSRSRIGIETLNRSAAAFDMLEASGRDVIIVVGNHDMPYRDSRAHHSLPWVPKYRNLRIVDAPVSIGGMAYVPYIVPTDDRAALKALVVGHELVFGHFEFPGFLMNGSYEMPKRRDSVTIDDLGGPRYVFSGHFHARQTRIGKGGTTFEYIGNCFPHDFSDAGDTARGVMVIEPGGTPRYFDWPDAPTYHRIPVSRLADVLPTLGRRATVRATPDVELSQDDRTDVIAEVTGSYELRSFTIEPVMATASHCVTSWDGGQDMDSFIVSWLRDERNAMDEGISRDELVRLYLEAKATQ